MKQTIVINATNLGQYMDGIGVYVLNLLKELAALSSDLYFIVYVNRSCKEHLRDIHFPPHCELRWVSSLMSPDHGFKGHFLRLLYSNFLGLKHKGAVIFIASQLEAILFRRNQIITIHDIIPLLFKQLHQKQYYFFKHVIKFVLQRARWVITPSQHTKELLIERYGLNAAKIQVIHNGVRHCLMDPRGMATNRDEQFILFSGRLVPMKNLAGVLKAFDLIKDKIPHKVVITGRHKSRNPGKDRFGSLGNSDRVVFKGHVTSREMESLLSRASLLVFPSFYEGFGLPPLEGMAHGCPVVVSQVSSLPEVCGDAAQYVDPASAKSIAEGMYSLLSNPNLRKKMIRKGLSRARQFQWRRAAIKHLGIFKQALQDVHPVPGWYSTALGWAGTVPVYSVVHGLLTTLRDFSRWHSMGQPSRFMTGSEGHPDSV